MKTQADLERAAKLLGLALTSQVKLRRPWNKEVEQQTLVVCRTILWALELPGCVPLDQLLNEIEELTEGPGFNPMQTVSE